MVLGIYGAHGLGREANIIADRINELESKWSEIVYIDDINDIGDIKGQKVFKFEELKKEYDDLEIVVAVGEPAVREILYNKVTSANIPLATLIHPEVYVDKSVQIGKGVTICAGAKLTCDIVIGDNCYIQPNAAIGHDIKIGNHSVIGSNSQIGGASVLGERVYMGFLSGCKEKLTIGNDVIMSAGAIVFRDLPDNAIAVGNPARIVKNNDDKRVFK